MTPQFLHFPYPYVFPTLQSKGALNFPLSPMDPALQQHQARPVKRAHWRAHALSTAGAAGGQGLPRAAAAFSFIVGWSGDAQLPSVDKHDQEQRPSTSSRLGMVESSGVHLSLIPRGTHGRPRLRNYLFFSIIFLFFFA